MQNIIHVDTPEKVDESLEYLGRLKKVGFDTETNGLDPHKNDILLLQVGDTYKQYVYDVYPLGEPQMRRIINYLNDPNIEKVGHYLKFDYSMVKAHYGVSLPSLICTHVGSSLLTKGILNVDNSLGGCIDKYLNVFMDKTEQTSFIGKPLGTEFTKEQIEYSAADVEHMIPLHKAIQRLLDDRGMKELSNLEYETVRVCGDMEVNGIFLNGEMWKGLKEIAVDNMNKAMNELDEFFEPYVALDIFGSPTVNYNSPTQLLPLLKQISGEPLENTGAATLKKGKHPVFKALLKFRGAAKQVSTYGEEFIRKNIHPVTGRVHSSFRQLGTDSGRMASRDPNLQNIPSEEVYRACFRAQSPDYKIISADFSG